MLTNQKELRAAFWRAHPDASRRMIPAYSGKGKMYCTDTRTAWVDFIDAECRAGNISEGLAQRATLQPMRAVFSWEIQMHTDYGWECVNTEDTRPDARRSIAEYRTNAPGAYRLRRVRSLVAQGE